MARALGRRSEGVKAWQQVVVKVKPPCKVSSSFTGAGCQGLRCGCTRPPRHHMAVYEVISPHPYWQLNLGTTAAPGQ